MADGVISIDVELNEAEFKASLESMGLIVKSGSEQMVKSINNLSGSFVLLPNTITSVLNAVPDIINGVINSITGKNPVMTKAGADFFMSFIGGIPDIISKISEIPAEISDAITERFIGFTPKISDTGSNFFTSLISNMPAIVEDITAAVPEITDKIAEKIMENSPEISNTGYNLFCSLTSLMPESLKEIVKAPENIINVIAAKFQSSIGQGQFKSVGQNIVYGVWSGISSMSSWLSESVKGFFQGLVSGVTGFLGISSPSKLFRDLVGKNIALGVKSGIDGEMPGVITDTKTHMAKLADAANQTTRLNPGAADIIGRSNIADSSELNGILKNRFDNENAGSQTKQEISVTLEPTGDIRGFFDYISMGVKRSDYLNGGKK